MGRLAATILFRQLDGDRDPAATHVVPTRLIARASGDPAGRVGFTAWIA